MIVVDVVRGELRGKGGEGGQDSGEIWQWGGGFKKRLKCEYDLYRDVGGADDDSKA